MATAFDSKFGLSEAKDVAYAEQLLASLAHVEQTHIRKIGSNKFHHNSSIAQLIDVLKRGSESESLEALDELSHIFLTYKDSAAVSILKLRLKEETSSLLCGALARTIAISQDREFLFEQLGRLADEDPGVVAGAAQLLGYGRMSDAVDALCSLLSPTRIYESRDVIWALGEIGDRKALKYLDRCFQESFRVSDVIIAMGKIGCVTSIPKILLLTVAGIDEQKESAYRALAMILQANEKEDAVIQSLAEEISAMIYGQLTQEHKQLDWDTRFFMLICLSRLAKKINRSEIRRYLELSILDAKFLQPAVYVQKGVSN